VAPVPIYRLSRDPTLFPPAEDADPSGLLAVGGVLKPERLLAAYSQGIFPWYSRGQPILWPSPDPRFVLAADRLHLPTTLKTAFAVLAQRLFARGVSFIDCQMETEHLARFGAEPWPRSRFLIALQAALEHPTSPGPWSPTS